MAESWNGLLLKSFIGKGNLMCEQQPANTIAGTIWLAQLFNGRIAFEIQVQEELGNYLHRPRCEWCDFDGQLDDGRHLAITKLRVETSNHNPSNTLTTLEGFVYRPGCVEITAPGIKSTSVENLSCEVTNLSLYQRGEVAIASQHAQVVIHRIPDYTKIRRLMSGIRTGAILSQVDIAFPQPVAEEESDTFVHLLCGLLSFAQRSHVGPVAWHIKDTKGVVSKSRYEEPVFYYSRPSRPLIPIEALAEFVETTIGPYEKKYQAWNLGEAQDYYLQSLSLQSAWSQSLGFFNALETLKSAFLQQLGNETLELHVLRDQFHKKGIVNKVVDLLADNFDEFKKLMPDANDTVQLTNEKEVELQAIKSKIGEISRRAYKPILRKMFQELKVEIPDQTLNDLVNLRNQIIHSGSPNYEKGPWKDSAQAWQSVQTFAGVLEKTILAILEYQGKFEAYDQ